MKLYKLIYNNSHAHIDKYVFARDATSAIELYSAYHKHITGETYCCHPDHITLITEAHEIIGYNK